LRGLQPALGPAQLLSAYLIGHSAFAHYGMHRVIARVDGRNKASARLCERVGMTREAHLRRDEWAKGEWTDTLIYGLLTEEWPASTEQA